ncbi:hypothetical protein Avbf_01540 [Armadillidium vulgare]|nr:hypothetical protein Avbf_01540 [Armadillidium vulgare]
MNLLSLKRRITLKSFLFPLLIFVIAYPKLVESVDSDGIEGKKVGVYIMKQQFKPLVSVKYFQEFLENLFHGLCTTIVIKIYSNMQLYFRI